MNPALLALILTQAQAGNLNYALQAGEPYGLSYTLAGLEWQESSFCRFKVNRWSRGCTGLKRDTARMFDPGVTRKQLTDDNERNLRDGLAYLLYCRANTKSWRAEIYCFHYGLPAARLASVVTINSDGYVKAIEAKVAQLKEIPISHE